MVFPSWSEPVSFRWTSALGFVFLPSLTTYKHDPTVSSDLNQIEDIRKESWHFYEEVILLGKLVREISRSLNCCLS